MFTRSNSRAFRALALLGATAMFSTACMQNTKPLNDAMPNLEPVKGPIKHQSLEGTIGELAFFADSSGVIVTGYGVIGGLPGTGSKTMPPAIRNLLEEMLYQRGLGSATEGTLDFDPRAILESNTISAVEVRGTIPPLSRKGSSFDLWVTVLPGSQTVSLNRGILWASDLKIINGLLPPGGEDSAADTKVIAHGEGPLFCTPDMSPRTEKEVKRDLRSALVINGGVVQEDMPIQLQLRAPNYQWTRAIERAINSRWISRGDQYATAENDMVVSLRIPPEYGNNAAQFVDEVLHVYLRQEEPAFVTNRARELVAALSEAEAPYREISVALQGLGRGILVDVLRPAYTSPNLNVRFYSAKAGAMMMDSEAMIVLQSFARTDKSPFQLKAIEAIAAAATINYTASAEITLQKLLDNKSTAVRITAYEGLVNMGATNAIKSGRVGRNFFLDIAPSEGPPLIYATRTGQRRIAIIGRPLMIPPNSLYISRDRSLTVNALDPNDAQLAPINIGGPGGAAAQFDRTQSVVLYSRSPLTGNEVKFACANTLPVIIARMGAMPDPRKGIDPDAKYIGASYQQIIEMIGTLTKSDLKAEFILQEAPRPLLSAAEVLAGGMPDRNPENVAEETPLPDLNATTIPDTMPSTLPSTLPTPPEVPTVPPAPPAPLMPAK